MALPDIQFAELDARTIEDSVIAGYVAARRISEPDFKLYDGNPVRLFLEAVAALIAQQNVLIDLTGKGNLLRYAGEDTIEDIGWLYGTRGDRMQPSAAKTTIRYTLSTALDHATTIEAGSRVTPPSSKGLYFATSHDLTLLAGQLTGEVEAQCEQTGTIGNGYAVGEISVIVERRNPFVVSAVNITASDGGAELEALETYREHVRNVPESFSVAGPDGAYAFWAKNANAGIIDVAVWSPAPGEVNIAPLTQGGNLPTMEIRDEVYTALNDKTRRPLTDLVRVVDPEPVAYDIELTYWINQDDATSAATIQAAVDVAVEAYRLWQRLALGRDIVPSKLIEMVMAAGAKRVEVISPVFTVLDDYEIAQDADITTTYGGLERA